MQRMLANMRVWQKTLLPLGLMVVTTIFLTIFMLRGTSHIDDSYTRMMNHDVDAAIWSGRANVSVVDTSRLAWRIMGQPNIQDKQEELAELEKVKNGFTDNLSHARKVAPEYEAEYAAIEANYKIAFEATVEAGRLSLAGKQAAAVDLMEKRQLPAIRAARLSLRGVVEKLDKVMGDHASQLSDDADSMYNHSITIVALCVLLISACGVWIAMSGMAGPIKRMTDAMTRLSSGDKAVEVAGVERKDEIGQMAKAVQIFKDNMIAAERLQTEQREAEKKQMSEQEERQRVATERAKRMAELTQAFDKVVNEVLGKVSVATSELHASATSMTATAEETSRQSTTVAAASEEATTNVQTAAASAEELSSSIAEISRQVGMSSKIANDAVDQVRHTNETVRGLAEAANKVGEVVSLINGIASQINLLALNATIEAARAGDAGKGFAVVAAEVKTLANQTAKATEEITAQIVSIQSATGGAVTAIEGIGATIKEINEIAGSIAAAVEEQSTATQEIARNVQQAAAGTREVSSSIGTVSQAASEVGSAASQVLSGAESMSKQAKDLKREVDDFLAGIKAA